MEVVDWFHMGLYLEVPEHELQKINHADTYRGVERCKTEALIILCGCMEMKEGSWSQIVRALVGIRMKTLARYIATKHSKCIRLFFAILCSFIVIIINLQGFLCHQWASGSEPT